MGGSGELGSEDGIMFCDYQGGYTKVGWDDTFEASDDRNSEVTALATAVVPPAGPDNFTPPTQLSQSNSRS